MKIPEYTLVGLNQKHKQHRPSARQITRLFPVSQMALLQVHP